VTEESSSCVADLEGGTVDNSILGLGKWERNGDGIRRRGSEVAPPECIEVARR
jgi:hypothetical protein